MTHRIANAKPRAAPATQPRNALLPEHPMTLHRNAPASQDTGTISRAKVRTAFGPICQTATSGMISLLQKPPPAPHRIPHPTPHRNQHRTQHSSPTWMLVGLPISHIRRGSRRAKPRTPHMHRLGPPRDGPAHPPPPQEEHRPAQLRPSKHVHSEVRWIKARDGSKRPVFQSHTGRICCAIECGNPFCRFDRLPCNKPLHSPASEDVHVVHRCSKCKELEA